MPIGSKFQPGSPGIPYINGYYHLYGTAGNDLIHTPANDTSNYWIDGGADNDYLWSSDGNDVLQGGDGNDLLNGDNGNDLLDGGAGDDWVHGGAGNDLLDGGDGSDLLFGDDGDDRVHGGEGDDFLAGGNGADVLFGDDGNDVLDGGDGMDWLDGGDGDDRFRWDYDGQGVHFDGGDGDDTIVLLKASTVVLDFENESGSFIRSIENVIGSESTDHIVGGAGDNRLDGAGGQDWIWGHAGNDTLTGGAGADTFVYSTWYEGADTITDFTSGVDQIALYKDSFGLTSLEDIDFFSGSDVQAGDRGALLYDTDTGELMFDIDGAGGTDAVVLATLVGAPVLTTDDIVLY